VSNPRIGEKLDEFLSQEVRRILVGQYEIRYAIHGEIIYRCVFGLRAKGNNYVSFFCR
jgi:hypothetical protein